MADRMVIRTAEELKLCVGPHGPGWGVPVAAEPDQASRRLPMGTQPRYKAWLSFSVFSFASPELESLCKEQSAGNISLWEIVESAHRLVGGAVFAHRYLLSSEQLPLLPRFVWLASLHCLLTGATLPIILLRLIHLPFCM